MKALKPLSARDVDRALKTLPGWSRNPKATSLSFTKTFKDHVDALVYIARITVHAQVMDHHPEITFSFKKVKVALSTHDVKGITQKDIALATKISAITGG